MVRSDPSEPIVSFDDDVSARNYGGSSPLEQ